jgi:hypothetical protein
MNINKVIKKTKPRYDLGRLCIGSISININVSRSQKLKKKRIVWKFILRSIHLCLLFKEIIWRINFKWSSFAWFIVLLIDINFDPLKNKQESFGMAKVFNKVR